MSLYGGIELPGQPDLANIQKLDLLPMPAIAEMERVGLAIDIHHFKELSSQLSHDMVGLREEICSYIPPEKLDEFIARSGMDAEDDYLPMNVESTVQLRKLLFDVLGIGKDKKLRRTKSGEHISTGKKQMEQLKHENPVIQTILDYRERAKLKNTYTDKLPLVARRHPKGDCWCGFYHFGTTVRVHTSYLTTRTSTGRLATKNPNLQNIPARKKLGQQVRAGFVASPGMGLARSDFSQIEMRLAAHRSRDENLLRVFRLKLDPHIDTARRAFGLGPDEMPDKMTQRDPSKTTNFQTLYGGTPPSIYDTLVTNFAEAQMPIPDWLNLEWVEKFQRQWFDELYPGIKDYIAEQEYRARRYKVVWTPCGRIRRVPEVRSVHNRVISAGLRQAVNMPIQGWCADLMKIAIAMMQDKIIVPLRKEGIRCWPWVNVHDEHIIEVEHGYEEIVLAMMEEIMGSVMLDAGTGEDLCAVPVIADGKTMSRWLK